MSITHIAFYPSDWLAGTRGMMAEEMGVYITLIARMYEMAGSIERNDERLYRICGCKSKRSFVKIVSFLISEGKIIETKDGLFNERVAKEIKKVIEKSSKAKGAAQSRWSKKPNKNNPDTNANAMQTDMLNTCQPEPELKKEKTTKKKGFRISEEWEFSDKMKAYAKEKGLTAKAAETEAEKFVNHWLQDSSPKALKTNWDAAFRNWVLNAIKLRLDWLKAINQKDGASDEQAHKPKRSGVAIVTKHHSSFSQQRRPQNNLP